MRLFYHLNARLSLLIALSSACVCVNASPAPAPGPPTLVKGEAELEARTGFPKCIVVASGTLVTSDIAVGFPERKKRALKRTLIECLPASMIGTHTARRP